MTNLVRISPVEWGVTLAAASYPRILNRPNSAQQPHLSVPLSPTSVEGPFFRVTEDISMYDRAPQNALDVSAVAKARSFLTVSIENGIAIGFVGTGGASPLFAENKHRYILVKMAKRRQNGGYETQEWDGNILISE